MSRLSLLAASLVFGAAVVGGTPGRAESGHEDPTNWDRRCSPCHSSHGVSGSKMLRSSGNDLCLECHDASAASPTQRARLGMSTSARPSDIRSELAKPYSHGRATCAECHSAHGSPLVSRGAVDALTIGEVRPSPKRGFDIEAELCLHCHGSRGTGGGDPHDLYQLFDPRNPSYHPVLAVGPAVDVPSLVAPLSTNSRLNCTNCHANDDPGGPRGPHGSRVRSLLGNTLNQLEGQPESATAYALCYACHDRQVVLQQDAFSEHSEHVVSERIPCSSCHDPHGATAARAMIRFNEPTSLTGVTPSSSGRLEFVDFGPGSGACYLTCHGENHDPLGYGAGFDEHGREMVPGLAKSRAVGTTRRPSSAPRNSTRQ